MEIKAPHKQRETLLKAELELGVGPVAMARMMRVPYSTYKNWRACRTPMPGVGYRCVELLRVVAQFDVVPANERVM